MVSIPAAASVETLAQELSPLWVARYRLHIRPRSPLALPQWGRGAILRGALGLSFRRLVCHDMTLDCRTCPLRNECPYPEVFETAPPAGSERLRNFSDIPRPFVFDPPPDALGTFSPQDTLTFGLNLVGRAAKHVLYFVVAFRNLADEGLGPRRARFDLRSVEAMVPGGSALAVYRDGDSWMASASPRTRAVDLLQPRDGALSALTLRFSTPLDLKEQGRPVARPMFGPLIRRLRDRATALAAFFGDRPIETDFKGIGVAADSVQLVEDRTRRIDVDRRSRRTGQRHDIGGLVGEARYEGEAIGALMPLVRLGEVIHVGRHAAFGNGRLEVVA